MVVAEESATCSVAAVVLLEVTYAAPLISQGSVTIGLHVAIDFVCQSVSPALTASAVRGTVGDHATAP